MPTTLAALARLVDGDVVGDGSLSIDGAATLDDATPTDITLVDAQTKADRLANAAALAVVVPRDFEIDALTKPAIVVDNVHRAFTAIVTHFRPPRRASCTGISPAATISPSARFGNDVDVHPCAFVDADVEIGAGSTIYPGARIMAGCKLGENVTVFPNAVIYEDTVIGDRCNIHASAVLGGHGFGYRIQDGSHVPGAQLGWVEIGRDVDIGACTTIDRGTYGRTLIQDGTKIDNQVMIAHNCQIGKHNIICSQVGIAGSTTTGEHVVMAGQVGIRDHVHIGTGAVLGAKTGVSNDIAEGARVFGSPATPEREKKQQLAIIAKLPEMRKKLKALARQVDQLQRDQGPSVDQQRAA
jgi:UDP-3-O-[3-hydroxymyristoyl] glucosamine N-acyltransferase